MRVRPIVLVETVSERCRFNFMVIFKAVVVYGAAEFYSTMQQRGVFLETLISITLHNSTAQLTASKMIRNLSLHLCNSIVLY